MVETTRAKIDLSRIREIGGFFEADSYGLIEVYGPDAESFLQAQTTNDLSKLAECESQNSCLLDRKAHIQAYFQLFRKHDSYRILSQRNQIPLILEHLEAYRFADKVEFLDLTHTGTFFAVEGPRAKRLINSGFVGPSRLEVFAQSLSDVNLWHCPVHVLKHTCTGEEGYLLWVTKSDREAFRESFMQACVRCGLEKISADELEVARVEAGLPLFGIDFSQDNFLPETGLEHDACSFSKGCFLGQEVLARVKSQGAPTRGLMGLLFAEGDHLHFPCDTKIHLGEEEIAWLRSNVFSTRLNRTIALAFVKRDFRVPDQKHKVQIDGQAYEITTSSLPFYRAQTAAQRAKQIYEQALQLFAGEAENKGDVDSTRSVSLLREALELNPFFEDAYEALGVILSRRGRLDEAISMMQRLSELNPDSVMAHTNLSVFYMEQGKKQEAEEEKATSMSIRMKIAAQAARAEMQEVTKKREEEEALSDRLSMFKEVLELDDDDLLANYGVGDCYVALGEFERAVPFLEKAIKLKPSYTVAYLSLGAAFERLSQADKAMEVYEQGIAVASKRGDLMPMQEMQKCLASLRSSE